MWGVYSEELHDGKVGVLGEKSGDFYGIAATGMALIQSGASPILPHHGDAAAEAFQCLLVPAWSHLSSRQDRNL